MLSPEQTLAERARASLDVRLGDIGRQASDQTRNQAFQRARQGLAGSSVEQQQLGRLSTDVARAAMGAQQDVEAQRLSALDRLRAQIAQTQLGGATNPFNLAADQAQIANLQAALGQQAEMQGVNQIIQGIQPALFNTIFGLTGRGLEAFAASDPFRQREETT